MILVIYLLGGLIALLVLALVFIPALIDEQAIIDLAQQQVRQATGGELSVDGDLELSLFPTLELNLGSTTIDLPPQNAEGSRLIASAGEVDVGLSFVALLSGADEVGDIRLNDANIKLLDSSGNLQTQVTLNTLMAQGLNIADQPMVLQGDITVTGGSNSEPMVINFDGAVRVPKTLDRVTLLGLDTRVTGALTEPLSTELTGIANLSPLNADLDLVVNSPGGRIDGDLVYSASGSPEIDLDFRSDALNLDRIQPANAETGDEPASGNAEQPAADPVPARAPPLPLPVG
ncbi:MAG: AsmA family protein, partial [Luminiphilus sp.]